MSSAKNEKVESIPCALIDNDPSLNSRSMRTFAEPQVGEDGKPLEVDSSREHETTLTSTEASIADKGQDTAVIIRTNTKANKKSKPYELVSGFGRMAAVMRIAEASGNKAPTIKAILREMSDREARSLNVRENTAREHLKAPDLAYGIKLIVDEAGKTGEKVTSTGLSKELGISQTYAHILYTIVEGVSPRIFKAWRESPYEIAYRKMLEIAKLEKGEQQAAFDALLRDTNEEGSDKVRGTWQDRAKESGARVGTMLGRLARAGFIHYEHFDLNALGTDVDAVRIVVPSVKKDATAKDLAKVSKAMSAAYEEAYNAPEEEEEEEVEATGEEKKSKKKKANGATAETSA